MGQGKKVRNSDSWVREGKEKGKRQGKGKRQMHKWDKERRLGAQLTLRSGQGRGRGRGRCTNGTRKEG